MSRTATDPIQSHQLCDGETEITVLSMGAAVMDWRLAGRRMVLGYRTPEAYRSNPGYLGAVVGRLANRVAGAAFELEGVRHDLQANEGPNQLHGGPQGYGLRNWRMTPEGDRAVLLELSSPDGDMGYPGAVEVSLRMTLEGGALTWDMTARPDRVIPVALAQHVYFTLGAANIYDHHLRIAAAHVTPTDAALIPTGEHLPVDGTRYDFRKARRLSEADPQRAGYDLNFALTGDTPQAEVLAPDSTRLRLWTDQPGLQLYTATGLAPSDWAPEDQPHGPFTGLCLEAQGFPNAVNTPQFPSVLCSPDAPYRQRTTVEITR